MKINYLTFGNVDFEITSFVCLYRLLPSPYPHFREMEGLRVVSTTSEQAFWLAPSFFKPELAFLAAPPFPMQRALHRDFCEITKNSA